jgi:tetratricopeptide (TPR) repeat protein
MKKLEEIYYRGIELLLEGNPEGALGTLDAVLAQEPKYYQALMKSGEILRSLGRFSEAAERHYRASELKPDDLSAMFNLVEDYRGEGNNDKVIDALQQILDRHPKNPTTLRLIRDTRMKMGQWEEAAAVQEQIESSFDDPKKNEEEKNHRYGIRYQIACKKGDASKWKDAVSILRGILKADPKFLPAYIKLAECYEKLDDEEEAVKTLAKGYEVTRHPILLSRVEQFYLDREQPTLALEHLGRVAFSSRKDLIPRFALGKLYRRLEMLDEALDQFERVQEQAPESPTLHYYLGNIHERKGNFQVASSEYRKVIKSSQILKVQYVCSACGEKYADWIERCRKCGKWNVIDADLNAEMVKSGRPAVTAF